jgi:hypothetical protein
MVQACAMVPKKNAYPIKAFDGLEQVEPVRSC